MAYCPGDGTGQVLFCTGNVVISMQLAGRYYCGGVVAAEIGVVTAVNPSAYLGTYLPIWSRQTGRSMAAVVVDTPLLITYSVQCST